MVFWGLDSKSIDRDIFASPGTFSSFLSSIFIIRPQVANVRQQLRHVIMSHVRTMAHVSLMKYQPSVFVRQNSLVYSVNTEKVSDFKYSIE